MGDFHDWQMVVTFGKLKTQGFSFLFYSKFRKVYYFGSKFFVVTPLMANFLDYGGPC